VHFGAGPAQTTPKSLGVGIFAALLSLVVLRMPHPPAGATTLIVSLGVLTTPAQLLSMAGAVLLVTAVAWGLNIVLGTRPSAKAPGQRRDLAMSEGGLARGRAPA
jgi:hypothetical protein